MIESRFHGLYGGKKSFHFREVLQIEHPSIGRRLVGVVVEYIPARKNQVVESAEWHERFDRRSAAVGPLAKTNGSELRQGSHRLRFAGAHQLYAGHEGGAHGAESREQDTEFSLGGSDFSRLFHATPFEFAIAWAIAHVTVPSSRQRI